MAYVVLKLITNAFYLSQVVSRDLETVSGSQFAEGLDELNGLLSLRSANSALIPYYQEFELELQQGVEKYFIENLIEPETFTFNIGELRYQTYPVKRRQQFGTGRVDNIEALPFNWHTERVKGGSDLYVYFLPNSDFPAKIFGKFGFESVSLNEDLEITYDLYYIDYLRYKLAQRICSVYGISFPSSSVEQLKEIEETLITVSPRDLSLKHVTQFSRSSPFNWADVNLGFGWRPG